MIIQLSPPLPIITRRGKALAHFLVDYGPEADILWVCFQDDTGECWTFSNRDIRAEKNITQGRENISPFYNPYDVALTKTETHLQKQERLAKKMTVTDPFFEKHWIHADNQEHKCCVGEFTCHYLGDTLTLTCQENGRDSIHTLVKICPFCRFEPK